MARPPSRAPGASGRGRLDVAQGQRDRDGPGRTPVRGRPTGQARTAPRAQAALGGGTVNGWPRRLDHLSVRPSRESGRADAPRPHERILMRSTRAGGAEELDVVVARQPSRRRRATVAGRRGRSRAQQRPGVGGELVVDLRDEVVAQQGLGGHPGRGQPEEQHEAEDPDHPRAQRQAGEAGGEALARGGTGGRSTGRASRRASSDAVVGRGVLTVGYALPGAGAGRSRRRAWCG